MRKLRQRKARQYPIGGTAVYSIVRRMVYLEDKENSSHFWIPPPVPASLELRSAAGKDTATEG